MLNGRKPGRLHLVRKENTESRPIRSRTFVGVLGQYKNPVLVDIADVIEESLDSFSISRLIENNRSNRPAP